MLFQIIDNLIIILFVLFIIYIFRGYHLSRREKEFNDDGSEN